MIRFSNRLFLVLMLALGGVAVAACGDSDGDNGGGGSGLSNGTKLSELNESQAIALCNEVASGQFGTAIASSLCTFEGIFAEQVNGETCETVRDECVREGLPDCEADVAAGDYDVQDCDLTVGEYRACLDAYGSAARDAYKDITCDADLESLEGQEELQTPEACLVVEQKCPSALEGTEDEQSFASPARRFALRARK